MNSSIFHQNPTRILPPESSKVIEATPTVEVAANVLVDTSQNPLAVHPKPSSYQFDRYITTECIGEGGMGRVYRAVPAPGELSLYDEVAIKILNGKLKEGEAGRLQREAYLGGGLDGHPHLPKVITAGTTADGAYFIVFTYIRGDNFQTLLNTLPKDPTERNKLEFAMVKGLAQCLTALDYLHQKGIIHRDIKPGNLMLSPDGAKLLDLGLAKRATDPQFNYLNINTEKIGLPDSAITPCGYLIGTLRYMSPEQTKGNTIDHRSDIFSAGVTLYQILTSELPFGEHGASNNSILGAISGKERPKDPCEARATVDPVLRTICLKALEKNPDDRFASAKQMSDAIFERLAYLERKVTSRFWRFN